MAHKETDSKLDIYRFIFMDALADIYIYIYIYRERERERERGREREIERERERERGREKLNTITKFILKVINYKKVEIK